MAKEGLDDGALDGPSAQSKVQASAVTQGALETLDELNRRGEIIAEAAEKSERLANVRIIL